MLAGKKPMAVFTPRFPSRSKHPHTGGQPFRKWVKCERIKKFDGTVFDANKQDVGVVYTLYTRPREVWRARAYLSLKHAGAKSGWSVAMERAEGMLLGYFDEQIDLYLRSMFRSDSQGNHGPSLVVGIGRTLDTAWELASPHAGERYLWHVYLRL